MLGSDKEFKGKTREEKIRIVLDKCELHNLEKKSWWSYGSYKQILTSSWRLDDSDYILTVETIADFLEL